MEGASLGCFYSRQSFKFLSKLASKSIENFHELLQSSWYTEKQYFVNQFLHMTQISSPVQTSLLVKGISF